MREIKFRAWSKIAQKMANVSMMGLGMYLLETEDGYSGSNDMEDIKLMQYTGLKDKNGKEIYEGDIVRVDVEIIEVRQPELFECDAFVVYGYEFCSGYFIDNYNKVGLDRFYSHQPEVIGNIYENKELLR